MLFPFMEVMKVVPLKWNVFVGKDLSQQWGMASV